MVIELAYVIDVTNAYDYPDFLFFLSTGNINFKLSYNIVGTCDYFWPMSYKKLVGIISRMKYRTIVGSLHILFSQVAGNGNHTVEPQSTRI